MHHITQQQQQQQQQYQKQGRYPPNPHIPQQLSSPNQNLDIYTSPYRKAHKPSQEVNKRYLSPVEHHPQNQNQGPLQQIQLQQSNKLQNQQYQQATNGGIVQQASQLPHGGSSSQSQNQNALLNQQQVQLQEQLKKERETNSQLQQKIKEMLQKQKYVDEFQNKMKFLINENDRLNSQLEEQKNEKFQEFENKVDLLVNENEKLNGIIVEMESKMQLLLQENENMSEMLQEDSLIITKSNTKKRSFMNKSLTVNENDVENIKTERDKYKDMSCNWERKIEMLIEENENLNNLMKNKIYENEILHKNLEENFKNAEIMENKFQSMIEAHERQQQLISSYEIIKEERDEYKKGFDDIESKFETLIEENCRLNNLIKLKLNDEDQNQETTMKYTEIQEENQILNHKLQQKEKLLNEIDKQHANQQIESEKNSIVLENKINQLTKNIQELNKENEQITYIIQDNETIIQQMDNKLKYSEQIIQNLQEESNKRGEQNQKVLILDDLETRIDSLVSENTKLLEIEQENQLKIQNLNKKIEELIQEKQENKIRKSSAEQPNLSLNSSQQSIHLLSSTNLKEGNSFFNKNDNLLQIEDARQRFQEYQYVYQQIVSEFQFKLETEQLNFENQLKILQDKVDYYQGQSVHHSSEISSLNNSLQENFEQQDSQNEEITKLRQEIYDLNNKLSNYKKEKTEFEEAGIKYEGEIQGLNTQLNQIKAINENGKQEINKLYTLLKSRKEQYEIANSHLEELRFTVMNLTNKNSKTEKDNKIYQEQLQNYKRDLNVMTKENELMKSGQEFDKNKELSSKLNELETMRKNSELIIQKLAKYEDQFINQIKAQQNSSDLEF